MNYIYFDKNRRIKKSTINNLYSGSANADEIFIFAEFDLDEPVTDFNVSVMFRRSDGFKIGPVVTTPKLETDPITGEENKHCFSVLLGKDCLDVSGPLQISVNYHTTHIDPITELEEDAIYATGMVPANVYKNVLIRNIGKTTELLNLEALIAEFSGRVVDAENSIDTVLANINALIEDEVLQEAKDYTYSQVEIDNKDTAIMNKANNLENANMFKDVSYNNVNGVLTFTRYDDTTKEIDLPLELIVTSGYYDEVANELVLVLANSSEIRIPIDNLLTDLDAHNIRFNGSGTNYLVNKNDVESAVKELDTRVKTNADNVALKVNTSDIVDNLTSTDTNKPLSANQGKVLKDLYDDITIIIGGEWI